MFLYYRVEQILGIKPEYEALKNLNDFIEKNYNCAFIDNPASYENILTSREEIFNISKYITVSETYFFRECAHFKILEDLLPELSKLNRTINICSAACSIGCEPYSIAMLLDYHIKKGLKLDYAIDAFDINNEAIETAKNARYTNNCLRNDGASWKYILDTYLTPSDGALVVSQNIRERVKFFPQNITRGFDKQYDIIFFRNALIYFTSRSKFYAINNISSSLLPNGYLFLGISETSCVNHPLLENRYSSDTFYFQKICNSDSLQQLNSFKNTFVNSENKDTPLRQEKKKKPKKTIYTTSVIDNNSLLNPIHVQVNCEEINKILETEEGKPNAQNVFKLVSNKTASSLSGGSLAASVVYFLNTHDFDNADIILSYLETQNSGSITKFLRGEYLYLNGNNTDAENYYQEAAIKDKIFWPAYYRIAGLASEGNRARYKYKIKKTIESIQLSQNHENNYECFLGGFSSDYFLMVLEKKLT